jgi:hypothetical protein
MEDWSFGLSWVSLGVLLGKWQDSPYNVKFWGGNEGWNTLEMVVLNGCPDLIH